jgi:hypothetical protein
MENTQYSDARLKENVEFIQGPDLNQVNAVKLVKFNYKNDETKRKYYGVIAQDVLQAGLNDLVETTEEGFYGVDYTSFSILKIAELQAFSNQLLNRIAELENRVKKLEEKNEK